MLQNQETVSLGNKELANWEEQRNSFWDVIEVFDKQGLLPYVMLIGSWAEYLYEYYLGPGFKSPPKTTDADFLYRNLYRPKDRKISISQELLEKGFIYYEHALSEIGRYQKADILKIEFLTRVLGSGNRGHEVIPSLGIKGISLRDIDILHRFPITLECRGYTITVPAPEAYVMQKLLINPKRQNEDKKAKDMLSIRRLLLHLDRKKVRQINECLTKTQQRTIERVCAEYYITL